MNPHPLGLITRAAVLVGCLFSLLSTPALGQKDNADQLLLKDYRPQSLFKNNDTWIEKAKYPVIDMHSHAYARSEADLSQWVQTMDKMGIDKTVVMTYETGAAFDSLYRAYSKYPGRFILFRGFDYTGYDEAGFGPEIGRASCRGRGWLSGSSVAVEIWNGRR